MGGIDFNELAQKKINQSKEKQINQKPKQIGNSKNEKTPQLFGINIDFAMGIVKQLPKSLILAIVYAIGCVLFTTGLLIYLAWWKILVCAILGIFISYIISSVISRIKNNIDNKRRKAYGNSCRK